MLKAMEEPMTIFFPSLFLPNEQQTLYGAACELSRGSGGGKGFSDHRGEQRQETQPTKAPLSCKNWDDHLHQKARAREIITACVSVTLGSPTLTGESLLHKKFKQCHVGHGC